MIRDYSMWSTKGLRGQAIASTRNIAFWVSIAGQEKDGGHIVFNIANRAAMRRELRKRKLKESP